eukprot:TRINITY_DN22718_c0_g1_i1.p1 TRINITY_DN22718_c0_g1~~TRINITY_DN22718_c0_g1_i1.p1  ORF type:complete len:865 (+),score=226.57 TRINITY_DN22718_c0_g1_i1:60-2654(+)
MGAIPRCCAPLLRPVVRRMELKDDTPQSLRRKLILLFVMFIAGVLCLFGAFDAKSSAMTQWLCRLGCVWNIVLFAVVWARRDCSVAGEVVMMLGLWFVAAGVDVSEAAVAGRVWPLFILIVDCMRMVGTPDVISTLFIAGVCVVLTLIAVEEEFRFGLLDLPGSAPYAMRQKKWDCEKPPCGDEDLVKAFVVLGPQVAVFLVDAALTRGFAAAVAHERDRVSAAISTAQHLSKALAGFDLDAATAILSSDSAASLPDELRDSFALLLENLASYRPFLPSELFAEQSRDAEGALDASVPGLVSGKAAVVFTDIRQSTALWCASGEAMRDALAMHNAVIRHNIDAFDGYEVKTIGDSFMVSFEQALEAVRFGLRTQQDLDGVVWPAGLTRPNLDDGFGVLSIRIGIHAGEVVAECNALTDRYDYFGTAVNTAARVEALGISGAVTITAAVRQALGGDDLDGALVVPYAEAKAAKGLAEELVLVALLPKSLQRREAHVRQLCGMRRDADDKKAVVDHQGQFMRKRSRLSMCRSTASSAHVSTHASVASVATVKFAAYESFAFDDSGVEEALKQRLESLAGCVAESDGQLSHVVHDIAVASWNVHARCGQHVNKSLRCFVRLHSQLEQRVKASDAQRHLARDLFQAGLATGTVSSGKLTASATRVFMTLLGPCVDVSFTLCAAAVELCGAVLVASTTGSDEYSRNTVLRKHALPVDAWELAPRCAPAAPAVHPSDAVVSSSDSDASTASTFDAAPDAFLVYSLDLVSLGAAGGTFGESYSPSASPSRSSLEGAGWAAVHKQMYTVDVAAYAAAFATKDVGALERLGEGNAHIAALADLVAGRKQLSYALAQLRPYRGIERAGPDLTSE